MALEQPLRRLPLTQCPRRTDDALAICKPFVEKLLAVVYREAGRALVAQLALVLKGAAGAVAGGLRLLERVFACVGELQLLDRAAVRGGNAFAPPGRRGVDGVALEGPRRNGEVRNGSENRQAPCAGPRGEHSHRPVPCDAALPLAPAVASQERVARAKAGDH